MSRIATRVAALPRRPLFISLRALDSGRASKRLPQIDQTTCETSWHDKVKMNIYRARPKRVAA
jgi:hypothetical protein